MKGKKQRRFIAWLLSMLLALNGFLPVSSVRADEIDQPEVLQIATDEENKVASSSNADRSDVASSSNADKSNAKSDTKKGTSKPIDSLVEFALEEEGEDCTDWLQDLLTLTIIQDGKEIAPGGSIDVSKSFEAKGLFKNIALNDKDLVLNFGDYADFELDPKIALASGSKTDHPLKYNEKTIGILKFASKEEGLNAHIDFNEDSSLWEEYTDVENLKFSVKLEYDGSGIEEGDEEQNVLIFGKKYTVYKPVIPIKPSIKKEGKAQNEDKEILWTITVDAEKNGSGGKPLTGFVFTDDLKNGNVSAGDYVDDSFKIDNDLIADSEIRQSDNTLEYIFKEGDIGPKTITYKTKVPEGIEFSANNTSFKNSVKLKKDDLEDTSESTVTIFKKNWIKKDGKVIGDLGDKVEWYIEVNEPRHTLSNITIKDELSGRLKFLSAKWQKNTGSIGDPQWEDVENSEINTVPEDNRYTFSGESSDHLRLVITTELKSEGYIKDSENVSNTASVNWDGGPADDIRSDTKWVGVGYNMLNKSGNFDADWNQNHLVNWTVNLNFKNQTGVLIDQFKVYDLLVHDKETSWTGFEGCTLSAASDDSEVLVDDEILNNIKPRYGQRYERLNSIEGGEQKHIKIMKEGKYIADLLEISPSNDVCELRFSSKMLDFENLFKNGQVKAQNEVTLFEGNKAKKDASAEVTKEVQMLAKNVLNGEVQEEGLNGNTSLGNTNNGFNHASKTAFFRLYVNRDKQNLDDNELNTSPVTLTDKLPAGWIFDKTYNNDKGYKIFAGNDLNTEISDNDAVISASEFGKEEDRETAAFTFHSLKDAYVILVKAKLTDEQYKKYIESNENFSSFEAQNDATLTSGSVTVKNSAKVTVKTSVVYKNVEISKPGTLQWTIDYNPRIAEIVSAHEKVFISDTLGSNFELRLDSHGELEVTDENLFIEEMDLNVGGNLLEKTPRNNLAASLWEEGKMTYDNSVRKLEIQVPDGRKAYRVTYLTDLTGAIAAEVNNDVAVTGTTARQTQSKKSYIISESDASAMLVSGGYVRIKKIDEKSGKGLNGAIFTLYTSDGKQLRQGVTAADGILRFGALRNGTYLLKETKAPEEYVLSPKKYKVEVTSKSTNPADGKVTTIYDGDSQLITFEKNTSSSTTFDVKNKFYAEDEFGNLTIRKTVAGKSIQADKEFYFTVTFDSAESYYYTTEGGAGDGIITGGKRISLKDGQSITIHDIPKGTQYEITEDNYSAEGYDEPEIAGQPSGAIQSGVNAVVFTNTRSLPGSLVISKSVIGVNADKTKKFNFTVNFNADGSYLYTGKGITDPQRIKSGDTIALADGESITIEGLPDGTLYEVKEENDLNQRWTVESTNAKGEIRAESSITAAFTNTYHSPSKLVISKTVIGTGADKTKKFNFTVNFNADGSYIYTGTGISSDESLRIKSGDTIALSDGEWISIEGLPDGTVYEVREEDYSTQNWTTEAINAKGIIRDEESITAAFTNTYHIPEKPGSSGGGGGGGGGNSGGVPKPPTPTTPVEPDTPTPAASKPREEMTPQELYDVYGEVPQGYMVGPDNNIHTPQELYDIFGQVPLGYMVDTNGQLSTGRLPKTGEDKSTDFVVFGLFSISALLCMGVFVSNLRRKHSGK